MAVINSTPLVMPTPQRKRDVEVDALPNLLVSTLALFATLQAMPVGMQSYQATAPVPPSLKYLPKVDPIPNNIGGLFTLIASAPLPVGKQLSQSAPPPKYNIQVDLTRDSILMGLTQQYPFIQGDTGMFNAPIVKYRPQVDVIPNLTLGVLPPNFKLPFLPYQFLPVPRIKQDATADLFVVAYQPSGQTAPPEPGPALVMPTPVRKYQPQVDVYPNTLLNLLPAGATGSFPIGQPQDFSQLQSKYNVYDVNSLWPNSRIYGPPVITFAPFSNPVEFTAPQAKHDVYDLTAFFNNGWLVNPIPVPVPPPPFVISGITRPGGRVIINPKKAGETIPYLFDFLSSLATNETITSASTACSVYSGVDSNPSVMVSTPAAVAGSVVKQVISGGIVGVTYEILVTVHTNLLDTIEMSGYLVIDPDLV